MPNSATLFIFFLIPFIFFIILRRVLVFSCDSFFIVWVIIEINILRFICYLVYSGFKENKGETLQYLFIQRISSLMFLTSSFILDVGPSLFNWLVIISLFIKLGAAPFHFWFLKIVSNLTWEGFFLLSTIQKILPLLTINKFRVNWLSIVLLTATVGVRGVFLRNNLKSLLTYSSLFSLSLILRVIRRTILIIFFLIVYSLNLYILVLALKNNFLFQRNRLFLKFICPVSTMTFFFCLLSMGGLPPIIGFFGKIYVITQLLSFNFVLAFFLLASSSFLLYLYLRLCFSSWKIFSARRVFRSFEKILPLWLILFVPLIFI